MLRPINSRFAAISDQPHVYLAAVAGFPDLEFRIGSMTKQFTAALVLLEQEDGKLSVDDPICKYLPGSPGRAKSRL
jgi:CubicO group peptidase (beta-lactamase class C family)